jgi:tetratricopeptide (TPR) repeat protein
MMNGSWSAERLKTVIGIGGAPSTGSTDRNDGSVRLEEAATFIDIAARYLEYCWPDKAKRFARRALTIFERELVPSHPSTTRAVLLLAVAHRDGADYENAQALYGRALTMVTTGPNADDRVIGRLRLDATLGLAQVLGALGRHGEAETLLKGAFATAERVFGAETLETASVLNDLGACYKYTGRFDKAFRLLHDALAIAAGAGGAEHRQVATILQSIAVLELVRGRFREGEPYARRSIMIREKAFGPDHPQVAADLGTLAAILQGEGAYAEAEATYRRVLTMRERWFGPDHYQVALTLSALAALVRLQERVAEAQTMYFRALTIVERPLPDSFSVPAQSLQCA